MKCARQKKERQRKKTKCATCIEIVYKNFVFSSIFFYFFFVFIDMWEIELNEWKKEKDYLNKIRKTNWKIAMQVRYNKQFGVPMLGQGRNVIVDETTAVICHFISFLLEFLLLFFFTFFLKKKTILLPIEVNWNP